MNLRYLFPSKFIEVPRTKTIQKMIILSYPQDINIEILVRTLRIRFTSCEDSTELLTKRCDSQKDAETLSWWFYLRAVINPCSRWRSTAATCILFSKVDLILPQRILLGIDTRQRNHLLPKLSYCMVNRDYSGKENMMKVPIAGSSEKKHESVFLAENQHGSAQTLSKASTTWE